MQSRWTSTTHPLCIKSHKYWYIEKIQLKLTRRLYEFTYSYAVKFAMENHFRRAPARCNLSLGGCIRSPESWGCICILSNEHLVAARHSFSGAHDLWGSFKYMRLFRSILKYEIPQGYLKMQVVERFLLPVPSPSQWATPSHADALCQGQWCTGKIRLPCRWCPAYIYSVEASASVQSWENSITVFSAFSKNASYTTFW